MFDFLVHLKSTETTVITHYCQQLNIKITVERQIKFITPPVNVVSLTSHYCQQLNTKINVEPERFYTIRFTSFI